MNNLDRIKSLRAQDYGVAGLSTTDVDWLIAEVERLTAERDRYKAWHDEVMAQRTQAYIVERAMCSPTIEQVPAISPSMPIPYPPHRPPAPFEGERVMNDNVSCGEIRFIEDAGFWVRCLRERELHGIAAAFENIAKERDSLRARVAELEARIAELQPMAQCAAIMAVCGYFSRLRRPDAWLTQWPDGIMRRWRMTN